MRARARRGVAYDRGMRVGIDWRPAVSGRGGIAAYVRALVGAYAPRFLDARQDLAWAASLPLGLAPSTLLAS